MTSYFVLLHLSLHRIINRLCKRRRLAALTRSHTNPSLPPSLSLSRPDRWTWTLAPACSARTAGCPSSGTTHGTNGTRTTTRASRPSRCRSRGCGRPRSSCTTRWRRSSCSGRWGWSRAPATLSTCSPSTPRADAGQTSTSFPSGCNTASFRRGGCWKRRAGKMTENKLLLHCFRPFLFAACCTRAT